MKVLLWDIDGTLVRSGYAGLRAMNAAAETVLGIRDAFSDFDFAGRTDPWALETICAKHGRQVDAAGITRFYELYFETLRRELHNPNARVCAGIRELLTHFAARAGTAQGLLTGNVVGGARVKLEHFGLWNYFAFGAYADDSGDRNRLGAIALKRARAHLARNDLTPRDLVIIGDTPHDVACARAVGAHCVIVATGRFSTSDLAPHNPDLLVADFGNQRPLIDFVDGLN